MSNFGQLGEQQRSIGDRVQEQRLRLRPVLGALLDVLQGDVDAAVVISNNSDLRHPIQQARLRVPVGTVNPSPTQLAGALRGTAADGVGRHWWRKLTTADFTKHQLADPAGGYSRPVGW